MEISFYTSIKPRDGKISVYIVGKGDDKTMICWHEAGLFCETSIQSQTVYFASQEDQISERIIKKVETISRKKQESSEGSLGKRTIE